MIQWLCHIPSAAHHLLPLFLLVTLPVCILLGIYDDDADNASAGQVTLISFGSSPVVEADARLRLRNEAAARSCHVTLSHFYTL